MILQIVLNCFVERDVIKLCGHYLWFHQA